MIARSFAGFVMALCALAAVAAESDNAPGLFENGAIVRRNGVYFNNRPLYANPTDLSLPYYYVFTGDRPLVRFGGHPWMDGCFVLGFQKQGGEGKWLLDFESIEFRYHGGRVEWVASDPAFPGVTISLHALPLATGLGMAAQANATGAAAGDRLVWMLGGASRNERIAAIDTLVTREPRYQGFAPVHAQGDRVEVTAGVIRLEPPRGDRFRFTLAACSAASEVRVADAQSWKTPGQLLASTADRCPVACGLTPIEGPEPITWIARAWAETDKQAAAPNVATEFPAAWERVESLNNRVVSRTPDARFDFMVRAASAALDGVWRGRAYAHGGSGPYPSPFLGWRTVIGGMAYGWHERVLTAARHFFASQVTGESYRDHPDLRARVENNTALKRYEATITHPGGDPRYLGKGRLIPDAMSTMYDMQSIFFDQVIEDWRFTADPELEKILRPALELHLDYIRRCFDPDGNGAYESFINTYLTDNQWYNGGDTAEETAFAYRGHLAARDMARRAGDQAAVERHEASLALIRKGFFEAVWVEKAGHPGAYREQGGHRRLHPDPWLPSIVHALDCPGLFTPEQMASTLHFTEYGLDRERRPGGGVRVCPSNWVPGIWSIRTRSPGEEHHLAFDYCLAGMPDNAMDIIRGCLGETAFESPVPGNFGEPWTGVDFTDFLAPFARAAVSGVFGYRPDRPNDLVTIAPQFPTEWDDAALSHPEFRLDYRREGNTQRLTVELQRESALELQLPFRAAALESVSLNGDRVPVTITPGFGRSICVVRTPVLKKAHLVLEVARELPPATVEFREVDCGSHVELTSAGGPITELKDAQGVLEDVNLVDGKASGRVARNAGHHRLLAVVQTGEASQWRIFDFLVRDREAEHVAAEKNLRHAPTGALWTGIDMGEQFNAHVGALFRQEYLSPRPDTSSARLDRHAYGTWHAAYVQKQPPGIDVSNTWPRRPAPVFEAEIGDLKLGGDFTVEVWVQADMASFVNGRILELGDLVVENTPVARTLRLQAGKTSLYTWPVLQGDRSTHLAVTVRSGEQVAMYINGESYGRKPEMIDLAAVALGPKLRLGADHRGEKRLLGRIERVTISRGVVGIEQLKGRGSDAPPLAGTAADWRIGESDHAEMASSVAGVPPLLLQDVPVKLPKDLPEPLTVAEGMLQVPQGAAFLWKPGDRNIAFTSLWDNWPRKITVPVNRHGDSAWLMICGSTNPMQVRIANAVVRFEYADGVKEDLELIPPYTFWSLCDFGHSKDYDYKSEAFSLPEEPPAQVQLGSSCRAMVYGWKLRRDVPLESVTLECLSEEVVIGLMGVSIATSR
ncbi:MAG: DUF4450 domain-containing protein [Planctomycetia bacterium]